MKSSTISQSGFSLIEMIVSLGVFSVVITIAVGALLVLIASNNQLQAEQSVMTNLSFALDSMTREIRTGSHYYCASENNKNSDITIQGSGGDKIKMFKDLEFISGTGKLDHHTDDCPNGNNNGDTYQGLAFIEGGQSITGAADKHIVYFYDESKKALFRRVDGETSQLITSSGIVIDNAEFYVTGSEPQSGGGGNKDDQPTVTIFVEAHDKADISTNPKKYRIQTTITQRALDI